MSSTRTNRELAVISSVVGILLLPILLFVLQSDCVFYYHYARYLLRLADPHELRFRGGRISWYELPREEEFRSRDQYQEFLDRLPNEISTKEDLSEWIISCLESGSPSLVHWAFYKIRRADDMVYIPRRSRIISLIRQHTSAGDEFNRRMARKLLRENTATRITLAKWAGLLGIAVAGVIAFKKAGKVPLKRLAVALGIAQVVVPVVVLGILFVSAMALMGGGDRGGDLSGTFGAIRLAKSVGILCVVCFITGWAFAMWTLIARIKGSTCSLLALSLPVLLAILININMLMVL